MWSIEVVANPGYGSWIVGHHISFFNGDEEFGDLGTYFSSPHVNVLPISEADRAKARLTTLLRLISGINVILGSYRLVPNTDTLYYENDRREIFRMYPDISMDTLFEELANPFDSKVIQELEQKDDFYGPNCPKDYFQLIVEEPLVRENILLFTLGEEEMLYFLVNTYKIVENIKNELKLTKNNNKLKTTNESPSDVPQYLLDSLSDVNHYSQYINSWDASGILSRHGMTSKPAPNQIPSILEIKEALITALNDYLNYKCVSKFGRDYKK